MKIVFTLTQLDAYAMALSRHDHFYNAVRSYNGVAQGQYYPKGNAITNQIGSVFILTKDDHGEPIFSICGEFFYHNMVLEDCAIYEAMLDVKNYLRSLSQQQTMTVFFDQHTVEKKFSAGVLAKKVKGLKVLLDNFNW